MLLFIMNINRKSTFYNGKKNPVLPKEYRASTLSSFTQSYALSTKEWVILYLQERTQS